MKILIVGGVAGGATAAARLRRLNESAEIIIFEKSPYVSFANCGLPYYIGGEIGEKSDLTLQTPESFKARFNIDVRVNSEVISLSPLEKKVTVKNLENGSIYDESYDKLILSPGAFPILPNIDGIESKGVFTLRNIPDTERIKNYIEENSPRSALIVGGGYIGLEMAENLSRLGLSVTVADISDHLVPSLDFDMAADLHRYAREKGVSLILKSGVSKIEERAGSLAVTVGMTTLVVDMVIISVGVAPDSSLASKAGLTVNSKGYIVVDRHMQTSDLDIYAVGDAIQVRNFITKEFFTAPLAGPANKEGRIAADNICGIKSEYQGTQGSAILKFFDMTVASCGLNESAATKADIDFDKTYTYSASHATYYPGASMMSVKLLWDKRTLKILGAQIVGFDGVDKRMDVISTAIRLGARVTELSALELCYAPPFGSAKDPVNMVGFVAENVISGKMRQFFWHDVSSLPRDGSVTLLDTRTVREVERGRIDGFINIPLDSLRENLDKIPKDKPVYVHCHSGLRSYIACRILEGYGYKTYNLAGGFRLYESVINERTVPEYSCKDCK